MRITSKGQVTGSVTDVNILLYENSKFIPIDK